MGRSRNFAKPHRMHALSELNVTPLLDLCFCLLIIFMIATPVLEQTTNIDLPVATGMPAPAEKNAKKPTTKIIALDKNGVLSFDGKTVTENQLRKLLEPLGAMPETQRPPIRLRCDGAMQYQRIFDLFSICSECKISDVGIDSEIRSSAH